jgi:hypothetical protein
MTVRTSPGVREALARFALELGGINDRFAEHEQQRSDALSSHDPARLTTPVPADDWDALLDAIKARLRHAVDETLIGQYNGAAAPLRVTVLECVEALDYLQAALLDARTGQAQIEHSGDRADAPSVDLAAVAATAQAGRAAVAAASSAAQAAVAAVRPPTTRA